MRPAKTMIPWNAPARVFKKPLIYRWPPRWSSRSSARLSSFSPTTKRHREISHFKFQPARFNPMENAGCHASLLAALDCHQQHSGGQDEQRAHRRTIVDRHRESLDKRIEVLAE